MPPVPTSAPEWQLHSNHSDKLELESYELPQNYSVLINKLEQLALGLDSAFANLTIDHKQLDVATFSGVNGEGTESQLVEELFAASGGSTASAHTPPLYDNTVRALTEAEYSHVVSDIWIGVILTLLIVSVVFFICSCFLYHKFQQWKNSYRANPNEPIEICRHYSPEFEAESLPSYTIVSGLPTYDDALEEFRKAGIILTPPALPFIKIFEADRKDINQLYNLENGLNESLSNAGGTAANTAHTMNDDDISLSSTCSCGAGNASSPTMNTPNNSTTSLRSGLNAPTPPTAPPNGQQVIELSPEQLAALSHKRLSLQIAFNNAPAFRRNSRPRVDLYRAANRNNFMRSYAATGNAAASIGRQDNMLPPIHRWCSSSSICSNDRNPSERRPQPQHLQHRGSLF